MQDADEWGRPGRGEVMTTFCMHGRQDRRRGAWRALAAALKSLSCDADSWREAKKSRFLDFSVASFSQTQILWFFSLNDSGTVGLDWDGSPGTARGEVLRFVSWI